MTLEWGDRTPPSDFFLRFGKLSNDRPKVPPKIQVKNLVLGGLDRQARFLLVSVTRDPLNQIQVPRSSDPLLGSGQIVSSLFFLYKIYKSIPLLFFDSMFSPWKGGRSRGARAFTHILTQLSNFLDFKEDRNAPWSLLSGNSQFRRIDEELTQSSYAHNTKPQLFLMLSSSSYIIQLLNPSKLAFRGVV